ncbi:uncharacterized protein [Typha latifolia]|uniref:uncharacterized protein n=1 Tax=Typha latifolia TaxID=4733 RepID=UPI003C305698
MAFFLKPKPSPHPPPSSVLPLFLSKLLSTSPSPPAALTPSESKLLDNLHALIRDHHRSNPSPSSSSSPPSPDHTIPSLSSSFAFLSPSPPSPSLAHLLIRRLSALRHGHPFPQALSFFNWWLSVHPSPTTADPFTAMIDFSGKLQHFDIARHLLDKMRDLGIPIPPQTFAILIRRYVRAGLANDAVDAFGCMSKYGLEPDPTSLASLLAALSKKRLAQEAQSLFDSYKSQFPPDVVLYSALIHAWCRAGRLDKAEQMFAEMRQLGITPNVYTYTTVIDAMCRAGQLPRAQELLCQMIDAGCPPNTATFNSLMRVHVKAGRTEQVLQVHNQMKQLSCEPDAITYNFLIETHCRKSQTNLDAALKVLNQMTAKSITPDCHSFNPIFRCVLGIGNVNAAHKLYDKMRELGVRPNTVTYNLLMQLFNKEKSMDMVLRMKKEMDAEGVEPNVNTYAALIAAFCGRGNWRRAYATMVEMVEEKSLKPSGAVYEMVLELLRRAGQLKKHEELVEKMAERGFASRAANDAIWY